MAENINSDLLLHSHPVEIYRACDSMFEGEAWLNWEPETLLMALEGEVSPQAEDKLLAVQSAASNSSFPLVDSTAFEKLVLAWCNCICVMDARQPPYVEEMCYAGRELCRFIRTVHGADADVAFSGDVPGYVAAVGRFRDWIVLPPELSFAQENLSSLTGLVPQSPLYAEHRQVVDMVSELYASLDKVTAEELLHDPEIKSLERDNGAGADMIKRIVGALLYDPTL